MHSSTFPECCYDCKTTPYAQSMGNYFNWLVFSQGYYGNMYAAGMEKKQENSSVIMVAFSVLRRTDLRQDYQECGRGNSVSLGIRALAQLEMHSTAFLEKIATTRLHPTHNSRRWRSTKFIGLLPWALSTSLTYSI